MSAARKEPSVRRVLLPLVSSELSERTLDLAADLASAFEAELVGMFVKEVDLLNLAELPFTTAFDRRFGQRRTLSRPRMEQALDELSEKARAALGALAQRRKLAWSFEVRTGHPMDAVAEAASEFDLLAFGGALCAPARTAMLGSQLVACGNQFLIERDLVKGQPILAVYDGSAAVLAVAAKLAGAFGGAVRILIAAADTDAVKRLQRNAKAWLKRRGLDVDIVSLEAEDGDEVVEAVATIAPALVVVESANEVSQRILDSGELQALRVPILAVG